MKKITFILPLLIFASSLSFAGPLPSMNKKQVISALEDKTVTTISLITWHGNLVPNNSVSVYFDKTGKMIGQLANKQDNYPQTDEGTWQVKPNGQICVNWENWTSDKNKSRCVYAYKLANSLLFVTLENKFDTMVLNNDIQTGNQIHT